MRCSQVSKEVAKDKKLRGKVNKIKKELLNIYRVTPDPKYPERKQVLLTF